MMSIHQPSSQVVRLLDHVLLLAGGTVVWRGSGAHAVKSFEHIGFPCPHGVNIAEHMLELASDDSTRDALRSAFEARGSARGRGQPAGDGHLDVSCVASVEGEAALPRVDSAPEQSLLQPLVPEVLARSTQNELSVLFWRTAVTMVRNPASMLVHFAISLAMGVLLGVLYWQVGDDLDGFQNRLGGLFFGLTFFGFASLSSLELFIGERVIFLREIKGAYYGAAAYFAPKLLMDALLLRFLPVTAYCLTFYFMMGLKRTADAFFIFWSVMLLFCGAATALCTALAMVSPNISVASLLATSTHLVLLLFGGFLIKLSTIPPWLVWFRWLSPYSYAFTALMVNEMRGGTFLFDARIESDMVEVPVGGETYLLQLGMEDAVVWHQVVALCAIYVCLALLALVLLLALRTPGHGVLRSSPVRENKGRRGEGEPPADVELAVVTATHEL